MGALMAICEANPDALMCESSGACTDSPKNLDSVCVGCRSADTEWREGKCWRDTIALEDMIGVDIVNLVDVGFIVFELHLEDMNIDVLPPEIGLLVELRFL